MNVAIIDSGGANIASLLYAFERLGCAATLTTDKATIQAADRVLLPGVGAACDAMRRLHAAQLPDVIRGLRQPVLGICLGMQLLFEHSAEEDVECLGIIPGSAEKLAISEEAPVPNMGWCETAFHTQHRLFKGLTSGSFFYYLHSYAIPKSRHTLATATHGKRTFSAVVEHDNFAAVQFHPERSSQSGSALLGNFIDGDT